MLSAPIKSLCDAATQTNAAAPVDTPSLIADKVVNYVDKRLTDVLMKQLDRLHRSAPPQPVPAVSTLRSPYPVMDRFRQLAYCEFKGKGSVGFVYTAVAVDGTYCAVKQANKDDNRGASSNSVLLRLESALLRDCIGLPHVAQLLHVESDCFNRCVRLIFPRYHSIEWSALLKVLLRCTVADALRTVRLYMTSLFTALRGIHARQIVHGDVKPDNFLYNFSIDPPAADLSVPVRVLQEPRPGTGVLIDFSHAARLPTVGEMRGTACWRAPEVAARSVKLSTATAADMWSAGVLFASLLTTENIQSFDKENYTNAKRGGLTHEFALCHSLCSAEFLSKTVGKSWMVAKDKAVEIAALDLLRSLRSLIRRAD